MNVNRRETENFWHTLSGQVEYDNGVGNHGSLFIDTNFDQVHKKNHFSKAAFGQQSNPYVS